MFDFLNTFFISKFVLLCDLQIAFDCLLFNFFPDVCIQFFIFNL